MGHPIKPLPEIDDRAKGRFKAFVCESGPDTCWEWLGVKDAKGYGVFSIKYCLMKATRVAWKLANGRDPKGIMCHKCDNPSCVNPNHLFEGSFADNSQDCVDKGRSTRGTKNSHNVIDESEVSEILLLLFYGARQIDIAATYGIKQPAVSKIKLRQNWRYLWRS